MFWGLSFLINDSLKLMPKVSLSISWSFDSLMEGLEEFFIMISLRSLKLPRLFLFSRKSGLLK